MLSDLLEQGKADAIKQTIVALRRLFGDEKFKTYTVDKDPKEGTVTIENMTFTFANGNLAMMGYCSNCSKNVPSRPIKRPADILDNYNNFKPAKHECGDLSG